MRAIRLPTLLDNGVVNDWLHHIGVCWIDWYPIVIGYAQFVLFERESDCMMFKLKFSDSIKFEILDDQDEAWLIKYHGNI